MPDFKPKSFREIERMFGGNSFGGGNRNRNRGRKGKGRGNRRR